MSRRAAKVTQADIARSLRAAKQAGAGAVRVMPDGTILIDMQPSNVAESQKIEVEEDEEVVL
jgi:hypothetical protein